MPLETAAVIREIKDAIETRDASAFNLQISIIKNYLNPPSPSESLTEENLKQRLRDVDPILNINYSNIPNIFLLAAGDFPDAMPTLIAIIANLSLENQQKLLASTTVGTQGTALMFAAQNHQTRSVEMIINLIENIEYQEKNEQNKSLSLKQELSKTSSSNTNVLMYAVGSMETTKLILSYVEKLEPNTQKSIFMQLNFWPELPKKYIPMLYNSIMKLSIAHPEVAHEILSSTTVYALKSIHQQSTKAAQTIRARHQTTNETSSFFGRLFKPQNTATERMSVESEAFNAIGNADL